MREHASRVKTRMLAHGGSVARLGFTIIGRRCLTLRLMPRYAAIDIGSNSIRMLAAEVMTGSPPKTLASSRQVTRLGEGVFRGGRISQTAMDLCSNVLTQMSGEYRACGVIGVRAVGTSALR